MNNHIKDANSIQSPLEVCKQIKNANPFLISLPLYDYEKAPRRKGWNTLGDVPLTANTKTYAFNTGMSRIVVLDGDTSKDNSEQGTDKLAKYFVEKGYRPTKNTLTVKSANGGFHVYFKVPKGVTFLSTIGKTFLGDHVDIRAENACIVAPGSIVIKRDGFTKGIYKVISETLEIAEAPDFIIEDFSTKAKSKSTTKKSKKTPAKVSSNSDTTDKGKDLSTEDARKTFAEKKIEDCKIPKQAIAGLLRHAEQDLASNFREGQRHSTLNSLSFQLGLVGAPEDQSREALKLDSRAVYKGWDEDPDEVFLTAYIDGLEKKFSEETLLYYRVQWNDERAISNYDDFMLPEFYSPQGLARYTANKFKDKYISISNNLFLEADPEEKIWSLGNSSFQVSSKAAKYVTESLARDIRLSYMEVMPSKHFSKLSNINGSDFSGIVRNVPLFLTNEIAEKSFLEPDKEIFATRDKVLNFKTGEIKDLELSDYLTAKSPIAYKPELLEGPPNEIVECLLSCIPENNRDYFLLHLGKALTADYSKYLVGLIGAPGIGKTALMEAVAKVIGPTYSELVSPSIFDNRNKNFEKIRLLGKRFVRMEEFSGLSKGSTQDAVNSIIDNETLTGERKGQDPISFSNTSSIFYTANTFPDFRKSITKEDGIARRFIPFVCTQGIRYKGSIKDAFNESSEAQEYLLALLIDKAFEVKRYPDRLDAVPRNISDTVSNWLNLSSEAFAVNNSVKITGDERDVIALKDLLAYLKSRNIPLRNTRELSALLKEPHFARQGVLTRNSQRLVDPSLNVSSFSLSPEDINSFKGTIVAGIVLL